jgi:hypothetical protein
MSSLFKMFSERKEQLQKQEVIDNSLILLNKKCPEVVSDYLLLQRRITRDQQYKIINTGFLYIYDEMQTQLNVNKKITMRILEPNMSCMEIAKIVKEG